MLRGVVLTLKPGALSGVRQRPLEVAADTFALRAVVPSLGNTFTNLNSAVILAREPVLIDTGMVTHRDEWFEDVLSLVGADEVRWIFVTHTDSDHAGNLVEALQRFPAARLVISRGESYRAMAALSIPAERVKVLENWESFDVGDRTLRSIRPPVYDSPYTRGLFDHGTGMYYSADAFCAPMPEGPIDWVEQIPPALWAQGMTEFHYKALCPWVGLLDRALFESEIKKLAALELKVIIGAHCPVIGRDSVEQALQLLAALPSAGIAAASTASPI